MRVVRNRPRPVRSGFTLIEILVVISIVAVLISILLPALSQSREQGKKVVCLSNMKQIGTAATAYLNDGQDNLPWTFVYVAQGDRHFYYPGLTSYSSYTWGGMMAPRPDQGDEKADFALIPPNLRALNRFLAASARAKETIGTVKCPGDSSSVSPTVGSGPVALVPEEAKTSWEAFGTSYSINWFFVEDPFLPMWAGSGGGGGGGGGGTGNSGGGAAASSSYSEHLYYLGKRVLRQTMGGLASTFVIMWENQADQLFAGTARDSSGKNGKGRLGPGWHRKFSNHTFLFLDGHAEHRYFNTVRGFDTGWRIWNNRPGVEP